METQQIENAADKVVAYFVQKVAEHWTGDKDMPLADVFNAHGDPARRMLYSQLMMNAATKQEKNPALAKEIMRRADCAKIEGCKPEAP